MQKNLFYRFVDGQYLPCLRSADVMIDVLIPAPKKQATVFKDFIYSSMIWINSQQTKFSTKIAPLYHQYLSMFMKNISKIKATAIFSFNYCISTMRRIIMDSIDIKPEVIDFIRSTPEQVKEKYERTHPSYLRDAKTIQIQFGQPKK